MYPLMNSPSMMGDRMGDFYSGQSGPRLQPNFGMGALPPEMSQQDAPWQPLVDSYEFDPFGTGQGPQLQPFSQMVGIPPQMPQAPSQNPGGGAMQPYPPDPNAGVMQPYPGGNPQPLPPLPGASGGAPPFRNFVDQAGANQTMPQPSFNMGDRATQGGFQLMAPPQDMMRRTSAPPMGGERQGPPPWARSAGAPQAGPPPQPPPMGGDRQMFPPRMPPQAPMGDMARRWGGAPRPDAPRQDTMGDMMRPYAPAMNRSAPPRPMAPPQRPVPAPAPRMRDPREMGRPYGG